MAASRFRSLRRRGPLALISMSSAVPTPPLMATGRLGRSQLDALERMLAGLSAEQAFRVLLVHHPLRSDSRIKRLTDSAELLALLKRHGVELVLHGHDHVHSTIWIDGPQGQIPVDRRAVGIRGRAWPLSGRGLQSVFDRARRRCMAVRADRARHRRRSARSTRCRQTRLS